MDLEDQLRAEREERERGLEGVYKRYMLYLKGRDSRQQNSALFALLISFGVGSYLLDHDSYIGSGLLFIVSMLLYLGVVGDTHKLLSWHQLQEDYSRTDD